MGKTYHPGAEFLFLRLFFILFFEKQRECKQRGNLKIEPEFLSSSPRDIFNFNSTNFVGASICSKRFFFRFSGWQSFIAIRCYPDIVLF